MRDKMPGILIVTMILFIFLSCSKDKNDNATCLLTGYVLGYNNTFCGCCPGWIVASGEDTLKIFDVPDHQLLMDMVNFYGYPFPIKFNYTDDKGSCSDYYKIMTCIGFDIDTDCTKSGEIIDYDYTECLCCPGWVIKTGEDTIKVFNLPIESKLREIAETSGFPISVELDFEDASEFCEDVYKNITCIQLK